MPEASLNTIHRLVWISLLAALITIGAYVHFPLGPIPVSLQPCFVLLAGFILGPIGGFLAVCLYILAGVIGLPIFYGGSSGLGHILGPTGGYILGFLFSPLITGLWVLGNKDRIVSWSWGLVLAISGYFPIYGLGLSWLKWTLNITWAKAIVTGFLPFLLSDLLQIVLAVSGARFLRRQGLFPQ